MGDKLSLDTWKRPADHRLVNAAGELVAEVWRGSNSCGPVILISDDSCSVRQYANVCFFAFMDVAAVWSTARSYHAAHVLGTTRVDLTISDLTSPGGGGATLIEQILRGHLPRPQRLGIHSAFAEEFFGPLRDALGDGACLEKPCSMRRFVAWAQALLERPPNLA